MNKIITPSRSVFVIGLKIFLLIIAVFSIFVGGWIFIAVKEIQLQIETASIQKTSISQKVSTLEGGTHANKQVFKNYLLFADPTITKEFRKRAQADSLYSFKKEKVYINDDLELPKLLENNCEQYRCIQNRRSFHQIPSSIWKALLGTEDFRFLEHRGVDPIAIARAIVVDIIAMKFVQGGSTLTQQLVKNLFLSNEKKLKRKGKELVYALYIENILSKEEIVTLYLNEVFWGVYQGVRLKGFYAASVAYFNKAPAELDDFEATILVSFLKGPNYYHPVRGLKRMKTRAAAVYKRLQNINLLPKDNGLAWDEDRWNLWSEDFRARNKDSIFYSYYLASKNGDDLIDSFDKLTMYESVEDVESFLAERTKGADIAVKILVASDQCTSLDCANTFTYYSKFERDKRKAMSEERHQVGSLFKPMVYESFVELGRDYDESISTAPLTLKLKSGKWTPKDYSRAKEKEIKLKVALQKSKNIPLIRVASEIGFDKLETNLLEKIPGLKTPLAQYPAQLLGALELSMEEVFQTYKKFISKKCEEIKDGEKQFEKSVLYYMSVASETTINKLAKPPLKFANIFGKTGTSNKGLDNWYFAFDGKLHYILWFGVESARAEQNLKRVSGAVSSFLIFQKFQNNRGKQISEIICN